MKRQLRCCGLDVSRLALLSPLDLTSKTHAPNWSFVLSLFCQNHWTPPCDVFYVFACCAKQFWFGELLLKNKVVRQPLSLAAFFCASFCTNPKSIIGMCFRILLA